ncbi:hypothetical protein VCHENC02_2977B, partial [Vibrio harveyi]
LSTVIEVDRTFIVEADKWRSRQCHAVIDVIVPQE